MNRSERESLLKNFIIFFLLLEILLLFIFFFFYIDKKKDIEKLLLKRMQVCSYTLSCKDFEYDFFPKKEQILPNTLYYSKDKIYALFPIPNSKKYYLKISYKNEYLKKDIAKLLWNVAGIFLLATLIIMGLSFLFTLYSLKPIREALHINQEFIKDILHDFNTPISSMVLNLEMLKKDCHSPFIKRIEQSIQTILSLQENLKLFLKNVKSKAEPIDLAKLVAERLDYFRSLYPSLQFELKVKEPLTINAPKDLLLRIIDNILSNACKYNKKRGFVKVTLESNKMIIEDSGKGIKESKKVFDRFYKESDRGIGIGLSIVKKLCDELDIKIDIQSELGKGTKVILKFPRT